MYSEHVWILFTISLCTSPKLNVQSNFFILRVENAMTIHGREKKSTLQKKRDTKYMRDAKTNKKKLNVHIKLQRSKNKIIYIKEKLNKNYIYICI